MLLTEIIGPDRRCSNISFASMGYCVNTPIMTLGDAIRILDRLFTKRGYDTVEPDITVRRFVAGNSKGVFIIYVNGHLMALHNGELVDTALGGINGRKVKMAFRITSDEDKIEANFSEWKKDSKHSRLVFDRPVPPKTRRTLYGRDLLLKIKNRYPSTPPNTIANYIRSTLEKEKHIGELKKERGVAGYVIKLTKQEFDYLYDLIVTKHYK